MKQGQIEAFQYKCWQANLFKSTLRCRHYATQVCIVFFQVIPFHSQKKVISPNEKDNILLQLQQQNCFTFYKTPQAAKYKIYFVMYQIEDKLWQAIKPYVHWAMQ